MEPYDEDIIENKFFKLLQTKYADLYNTAATKRWIICVPRSGSSSSKYAYSETDFKNHLLIPQDGKASYKTANDKEVAIQSNTITTGAGFKDLRTAQILFEETFFNVNDESYRVLCLDIALEGGSAETIDGTPLVSVHTFEDCKELLWGHSPNNKTQKHLDQVVELFNESCGNLEGQSLVHYVDAANALFTRAMQSVLKDSYLKRTARHNKAYLDNVKVAVETYIMHGIYRKIFRGISSCKATQDAKLNKITRNLAELQLRDLGIRKEFCENIPKAKKELVNLNRFSTPLGKLNCVKRVGMALMQAPKTRKGATATPLTTDDLLPILVFLVVKSEVPNWYANLTYMLKFRFSKANNDDEYGFYAASLEAAIEHVNSGALGQIQIGAANPKKIQLQRNPSQSSTTSGSTTNIELLFQYVENGLEDDVKEMLKQQDDDLEQAKLKMCHPLCSCDACEKLLARGRNDLSAVTAYSRDDRGFTALHVAALHGQFTITEILVKRGGVVNAADYHGSTPVHIACQRGHQTVTLLLVHYKADINATDNDGNTPLHLCVANGHEECVNALIYTNHQAAANNLLAINAANDYGDTPLHLAAKWGYEKIVETLVDNGAALKVVNRKKLTPLQVAHNTKVSKLLMDALEHDIRQRHESLVHVDMEMVKTMEWANSPPTFANSIAKMDRADSNASSTISSTSSSSTSSSQRPSATSSAQKMTKTDEKVKKVDKLLKCVADGDIEMVKFYLGWNELEYDDVDISRTELCHPLCQCEKCLPLQKISVSASGLSVNSSNRDGYSLLHMAALNGHDALASMLIKRGANLNGRSRSQQCTPLHLASQYNKWQVANVLLNHDAKMNIRDARGNTPLHLSCLQNCVEVTEILIKHNANVNLANQKGNTPLHEAARHNHKEITALLLKNGASVTCRNNQQITPVQLAQDDEINHLLVEAYKSSVVVQPAAVVEKHASTPLISSQKESPDRRVSIRDLFAAFEEKDLKQLQDIAHSIKKFNKRQQLRSTFTRDKSLPRFDHHLRHSLTIQHFDFHKLRHVETVDKTNNLIKSLSSDNFSLSELSEDDYHLEHRENVDDEVFANISHTSVAAKSCDKDNVLGSSFDNVQFSDPALWTVKDSQLKGAESQNLRTKTNPVDILKNDAKCRSTNVGVEMETPIGQIDLDSDELIGPGQKLSFHQNHFDDLKADDLNTSVCVEATEEFVEENKKETNSVKVGEDNHSDSPTVQTEALVKNDSEIGGVLTTTTVESGKSISQRRLSMDSGESGCSGLGENSNTESCDEYA